MILDTPCASLALWEGSVGESVPSYCDTKTLSRDSRTETADIQFSLSDPFGYEKGVEIH